MDTSHNVTAVQSNISVIVKKIFWLPQCSQSIKLGA